MGEQYVGIDLHRRRSVIVRMTPAGEVLQTIRVDNGPVALSLELSKAGPDPEAVLEATYGWYWAADLLQACGARVHLAIRWGSRCSATSGSRPTPATRSTWPNCCACTDSARPGLMAAGQHLDRLGQPRIPPHRPVVMPVGADQIGQHSRIPAIRLGPRDGGALPVAAGRQRIDRDHLVAGRHQCPHQQPPVGLDPDHHLGRVAGMAGDELVQPGHPGHPSAIRSRASTVPSAAITHTSWWRSAQSIPTNNTASSLVSSPLLAWRETAATQWSSARARHVIPPAVCLLAWPAGARS
jgi:hypothetical protein